MKRIQIFLFAIITSITLNSCNGTKEITIIGKPGTEIYSNDMQKISVIDNKGIATVEVNDYDYAFDCVFFSHEKESNTYIPFALNFEKKKFGHNQIMTAFFICPLIYVSPFFYMIPLQDQQTRYHFRTNNQPRHCLYTFKANSRLQDIRQVFSKCFSNKGKHRKT